MRRIWFVCLMGWMLCFAACSSGGQAAQADAGTKTNVQDAAEAERGQQDNGIWTADTMPVHLKYRRMWEYCAQAETEDAKRIADIVDAVKALQIGEEAETVVDDYTDRLVFSFADGSEVQLEFEADCWVADGKLKMKVDGVATQSPQTVLDDLTLDDISATPREKTREEIIAEAEAAAFADS